MELRRLEEQEHQKTRKLWEEVFSDDTRAFLDYYYFIKTKENEIWVIEEDGEIQSMLQLNPYQLQVAEHPFLCRYIIEGQTGDKNLRTKRKKNNKTTSENPC